MFRGPARNLIQNGVELKNKKIEKTSYISKTLPDLRKYIKK
jgi:hypothetical protein